MAFLHEVSSEEMAQAIERLAEDNALLALTIRYQGRWVTFRTRAIASHADTIWVEMPKTDHLPSPCEFTKDLQVGVAFSAVHRKYVFRATVVGLEVYRIEEGVEATALKLRGKDSARKVERRLNGRVDLSVDENTRATLWLGGQDAMPSEPGVAAPVWSGRVINLSAGGFLVRTSYEAGKYVEVGDIVGVQIAFDGNENTPPVDAQIRHCARDGEMALIGVQFLETDETPSNTSGIMEIRRRMAEMAAAQKEAQEAS